MDDDDTTIVTFHSLEESIQKRTTNNVIITTHNDDNDAADTTAFSSTAEVFSIIEPPVDKVPVATLADDDPSAIGKVTHQAKDTAPPTQLVDEPTAVVDANESPSDTEVVAMEKGELSTKGQPSTRKQETRELEFFTRENKYSNEPSKEFIQVVLQHQRQACCTASTTAADATFGAASPIVHVDAITAPPLDKVLLTTLADDDPYIHQSRYHAFFEQNLEVMFSR